ncbi:MAG: HlyD family efflux transporter periplasmic adaptor subunit, partial [Peptostreptococcales bacterium]
MRILKHFRKLLQKLKILLFKRKKRTISLVILLIIFMAVFSLVKGKTNLAIAPMTSIVTKEDIEYRVKVNGVVKSLNEQTVLSAIQGQVENIYFNQGDAVHKGDILATIDTTEIDSKIQKSVIQLELEKSKLMNSQEEMNSAKVTLSETEQKYNFYKETYESKLKLFEVGAISKMDLDESKLSLDEIYNKYLILKDSLENGSYTQNLNLQQKQVHLAESEHASLIKEKEKHFIGSPIDGIIAERYIQQGDIISPQKQLFYVVNNNQLEVTANVSEYDAKNIQKGNKVTITSDGIVEYSYESEISFVSPIAKNIQSSNSNESVVEVKTIITDDNLALKSGF